MTDFELRCSEKSIKEYVKMTLFGTTITRALPMIICAALLTSIPILGIVGYFMTYQISMLIVGVCGIVFDIGICIFLAVLIKRISKKLAAAYGSVSGLLCSVSDKDIIIVRDNHPVRVLSWDKISDIDDGKYAFYLRSDDDALVILEKDAVMSGSLQETQEIITKKLGEKK